MEKPPIIKRREYISIILFQKIHSLVGALHEEKTTESHDLLFEVELLIETMIFQIIKQYGKYASAIVLQELFNIVLVPNEKGENRNQKEFDFLADFFCKLLQSTEISFVLERVFFISHSDSLGIR